MIPLTSRILQPKWHVLYQWTGREEEQIFGFIYSFIYLLILLVLWACWDHMSVWGWAIRNQSGFLAGSALWNWHQTGAASETEPPDQHKWAGWMWRNYLGEGERKKKRRKEGGGSWVKKEERCVFCSQLHFFKIGKKKERAKKNLKEKKKPPHLAKPTIIKNSTPNQQKFPFKNTCIFPLIPVYPFEIQAGALILPPNKGSMGKGE